MTAQPLLHGEPIKTLIVKPAISVCHDLAGKEIGEIITLLWHAIVDVVVNRSTIYGQEVDFLEMLKTISWNESCKVGIATRITIVDYAAFSEGRQYVGYLREGHI